MQVIARRTLRQFWERYPDAEAPLRSWHSRVSKANWQAPSDVKNDFGNAVDFVGDNRAIFDIGGNKYRLVAHITYGFGKVLVKFLHTHSEYNKINAETVSWQKK
jgi:mRNA interferase HigB